MFPRAAISILFALYFFLIYSTLFGAQPIISVSLGVDPNIIVEDMEYSEICKCIRQACKNWEKCGQIKFYYSKKPNIRVSSQEKYRKDDVIGYHSNGKVVVISKIYPHLCGKKWDEELLTRILTHEIGHYLGMEHSKYQNDIMYYRPEVNEPSKNDLQTLKDIINGI